MKFQLRPARSEDLASCLAIYAHHVANGAGTFDETAPPLCVFEEKFGEIARLGLPWLVAETEAGKLLGFAYCAPYRPRHGYRYTLEDTVYVAPEAQRQGAGMALLTAALRQCEAKGARQVVAMIGDSRNTGSIALHAKAGFVHAGTMRGVGAKFGRWIDVVVMQIALNGGDSGAPGA